MMVLNEGGIGTPASIPAAVPPKLAGLVQEPSAANVERYYDEYGHPVVTSVAPGATNSKDGNLANMTVTTYANPNKKGPQVPGMQQLPSNQNLRANVPTNQNANVLLNNTLQLGQRLGQQQLANQIYMAMKSNDKRTLSNIVNRYSRSCPQLAQQANAFLQLNVYG